MSSFGDSLLLYDGDLYGSQTTTYQGSWSGSPFSANKQDPLRLPVFSLGRIEMLTPRLKNISPGKVGWW